MFGTPPASLNDKAWSADPIIQMQTRSAKYGGRWLIHGPFFRMCYKTFGNGKNKGKELTRN
jgi:hypothetical protein